MDFSNHKFRCSSLGDLMTNKQGKKSTSNVDELSETAKKKLVEIFIHAKYGRDKDIENKYIKKGLAVEEDSITLLSRVKKKVFFKNDQRISNDFITGEPDLFDGKDIINADSILDCKSSWDIFTFWSTKFAPVDKGYAYQGQGYLALTGSKIFRLCYCLVDTPEQIINDEKRKLLWKMGVATELNPDYIQACEELEKNMKFSDIPIEERLHEIILPRNEGVIESIYERVPIWREFLNSIELTDEVLTDKIKSESQGV